MGCWETFLKFANLQKNLHENLHRNLHKKEELSIISTGPIRPWVARKPFRSLQISTTRVSPPSCVAPRSTSVVRPLTSSMSVPILISKGESVVTLASSSICESTAETVVVVAIVVMSVVVMSVVVLSIVVLPIVIAVVVLSIVVIVITAAATVVAPPTKEEPFISSIFPLSCLPPLPAIVTGAGSTTRKKEPGFTVLSLPFATFAARVPVVEVAVVQGSSDCRSKYCCSKGS